MNEKLKEKRKNEFVIVRTQSTNLKEAITREEADKKFLEWIEDLLNDYYLNRDKS